MNHGYSFMLRAGSAGAALAGLGGVAATEFHGGLAVLVLPLLLFTAANGFINANAISGALSRFPHRAGAASAVAGAIQYGSAIMGSALVGAFADGTPRPMVWVIAAAGIGSAVCAFRLMPSRKTSPMAAPAT